MKLCMLFLSALCLCDCKTVHIYVSPKGSDSNSGLDASNPVATLNKARLMLDQSGIQGNTVYVELMGGYHNMSSALHFTHGYSQPVTFRAYQDQEVHVTGGKQISSSLFTKVTDSFALKMLPNAAKSKVLQIHLPQAGITDYGKMIRFGTYKSRTAPLEIFINGRPARLAQYPNEEFINIVSVPGGKTGTTFTYRSNEDSKWGSEKEPWAYGYWMWSWSDDSQKVSHIDTQKHLITLADTVKYGLKIGHYSPHHISFDQGGYFRMINMLSELDQPGEYYIDRATGNLYIWPNTDSGSLTPSDVITVSLINDCISMDRGVNNLVFEGFTLEACRHEGIRGDGLHDIKIQNMEVRNLGAVGIHITGSTQIMVSQCDVHHTNGGIYLSGGDRKTLTPSGNVIEDSHVWLFARTGGTGYHALALGGVANVARYNHLHDGQYTGIMWGGNDNIIEYNHIHHMCVNSTDCGAIHSGRDWTRRGNVIRYNHIHHVLRLTQGVDNRGVMLDDQYSSVTIEHNVFYDNYYHVNIGGGRDNIVRYNVFYDATAYPMQVDGRGLRHSPAESQLRDNLKAMPYTSKLWADKYPSLAAIDSHNPVAPMGNQIYDNVFFNQRGTEVVNYHGTGIDKKEYFNVHDNFRATSRIDFWSPSEQDFRFRCEAATWASKNHVPQPIGIDSVGPRHPPGPKYMQKQYDTECDAEYDTECDTECDTEYDTEYDTESDIEYDTGCDTECDTECDAEYDTECDTECETGCDTVYDTECDTDYDTECATEYDTECDTESDRGCDTEYDTEYDTECDTEYDTESDIECDTGCDRDCDTECDTGYDTECDTVRYRL